MILFKNIINLFLTSGEDTCKLTDLEICFQIISSQEDRDAINWKERIHLSLVASEKAVIALILMVRVSRIKEYKVKPKFWLIKFDELLGNEIKKKLRLVFKIRFQGHHWLPAFPSLKYYSIYLLQYFWHRFWILFLSQNENVQKYLKQVLLDVSKLMELMDQCSDYIPPSCGNYHQKVFNIIQEETGLYLKEFLTSKKDIIDRKCFNTRKFV